MAFPSEPHRDPMNRPVATSVDAAAQAKPRWERRKQDRPQEVIAAAFQLFVERGFAATRLEDVAQRAGVSKGTVYLYFTNKDELFKAVVRESIVTVIDEAEVLIETFDGSSAELFREIMNGWWKRIGSTSRAGIMKLVMSEAGNFPDIAAFYHEEVIQRGRMMVEKLLARGIASGEFRKVEIASARSVLMAPMLMLIMWKHTFAPCLTEELDPEQYIRTFIDLALAGLSHHTNQDLSGPCDS